MNRLDRIEKLVEGLTLSQKRTDEQINKTLEGIKELKEAQTKTDEHIKKLIEAQTKTDKHIKKAGNFWGNYGETVEEYFYRSLEKEKVLGGIEFDDI